MGVGVAYTTKSMVRPPLSVAPIRIYKAYIESHHEKPREKHGGELFFVGSSS
jgi:hypothetical protein